MQRIWSWRTCVHLLKGKKKNQSLFGQPNKLSYVNFWEISCQTTKAHFLTLQYYSVINDIRNSFIVCFFVRPLCRIVTAFHVANLTLARRRPHRLDPDGGDDPRSVRANTRVDTRGRSLLIFQERRSQPFLRVSARQGTDSVLPWPCFFHDLIRIPRRNATTISRKARLSRTKRHDLESSFSSSSFSLASWTFAVAIEEVDNQYVRKSPPLSLFSSFFFCIVSKRARILAHSFECRWEQTENRNILRFGCYTQRLKAKYR